MSEDELSEAMSFIEDHFMFLESKDGNLSTIDSIIDRTKQAIMRGANGVLIDPYNDIETTGGEEHSSIRQMLTRITSVAKATPSMSGLWHTPRRCTRKRTAPARPRA